MPLKIEKSEELRKKPNKNKTISIKNGILNDFLSGMVDKRSIRMFDPFLQDRILNCKLQLLCETNLTLSAWIHD